MALVKWYNKQSGITYVYDSRSYYDKEKHQSRSKRKLVGKIDPETGEMIPTGKVGRPPKDPIAPKPAEDPTDYKDLYQKALREIAWKEDRISVLEQELSGVKREAQDMDRRIQQISKLCARKQQ